MKLIPAFAIFSLLIACGKKQPEPSIQNITSSPISTAQRATPEPTTTITNMDRDVEPEEDTIDVFKLSNMTLTFSENAFYEDFGPEYPKYNLRPGADTLFLIQELGAWVEGQSIKIETDSLTNLKLEQRFETSVSLSFEGPHCDMIEWKHSYTPWKKLVKNSKGEFRIDTISIKDSEAFPKVSTKEFKDAVIQYCGPEALESFEGTPEPHKYPAWVGVSRIFIKITGTNKYTEKDHVRIIEILVPMGC